MATTRQELLREAEVAARRGDLSRAAEIYAAILERTTGDLAVRQRLADALARSGREEEAREAFRRLADDYWNGGYRARALAVLRRAIRLGDPDPGLLALLGERTLEQGLVADAREPLLLAARAWEERGEAARAAEAWRRIAEAFPRDVESRQALVRLADAAGEPGERARARVHLAEVLARTGDPEGAVGAFREALAVDRGSLRALDGLPSLLPPLVEAAPVPDASLFLDDDPAVAAGLALLRISLDRHAGREADPAPALALLDDDRLPPRVALWAGRVLLDLGELAGARRGILAGARALHGLEEDVRDLLIGSLSGLLTRDPAATGAMELLEELSRETGPVDAGEPSAPEPPAPGPGTGAAPAGREPEAAAPREDASPGTVRAAAAPDRDAPDPSHLAARLIEARRLLAHGIPDRALAVLDEVARTGVEPPGYRELREEVEAALRPAAPAETRAAAIPLGDGSPAGEEDDDGFEIVLDDFDDEASPPSSAGEERDTTTAGGGAGGAEKGGGEPGLDVGHLAREVQAAVSGEDPETTFQMGLGLVQMGLLDEGAELLGPVLASPERGWDTALVLARAFLEAGRPAEGLDLVERILDGQLPREPAVERELLGVLLEAARAVGDQGRVHSLEERLARLPEPA